MFTSCQLARENLYPWRWAPGWEALTSNVGIPEHGKEELEGFLDDAHHRSGDLDAVHHLELGMLARGLAMQGAGILPPNLDIEVMITQATAQVQLEGLLKGY